MQVGAWTWELPFPLWAPHQHIVGSPPDPGVASKPTSWLAKLPVVPTRFSLQGGEEEFLHQWTGF